MLDFYVKSMIRKAVQVVDKYYTYQKCVNVKYNFIIHYVCKLYILKWKPEFVSLLLNIFFPRKLECCRVTFIKLKKKCFIFTYTQT